MINRVSKYTIMLKSLISFTHLQEELKKDAAKCREVVHSFLSNIEAQKSLNAFVRTYREEVLSQVDLLTKKIERREAGELAGLVVGVKDMFCYKNHPLQASSKILTNFISQINATVLDRLQSADAIIMGHQNCDEFGMGCSSEHSIYGPVRNPIDSTRVAGGSSGGSAAALRAHMCHVSLGTDTGGSVRQPAAFCGLVGLRPTYGRISRYGVVAHASSFDTVGILSHNVPDCARVLSIIAGIDPCDNTSSDKPVERYEEKLRWMKKARVAYFQEVLTEDRVDSAIRYRTQALLNRLKEEGHTVTGIEFPTLSYALPTYYVLTAAEASSNLACYDGVRYGYRSLGGDTLKDLYARTRAEGFGEEVQRRILLGAFVLSASYYESYYLHAQKVRRYIKEAMETVLGEYDFILLPTTPTTAFSLGVRGKDPVKDYLADLYTVPAAVAGVPAISIPNGVDEMGLPIGVQLMGAPFREAELLAFSNYILESAPI